MGYPILVTPVSQFMATQAVRNVIDDERWTNVSDETVRYFLGHYGEFAAPVDPEIAARVLALPQTVKLRDARPVSLEGARRRFGTRISEEELLLRVVMPAEQVDAMRPIAECGLLRRWTSAGRAAAPRAPTAAGDLLPARAEGRRTGGVAPCVLRRPAVSSSTSTGRSCTAPARTRWRRSRARARCSTGFAPRAGAS